VGKQEGVALLRLTSVRRSYTWWLTSRRRSAGAKNPDADGEIAAPDAPGLGITVLAAGGRKYLQDVDIRVNGRPLFATAEL
jgi:hypothetical protein